MGLKFRYILVKNKTPNYETIIKELNKPHEVNTEVFSKTRSPSTFGYILQEGVKKIIDKFRANGGKTSRINFTDIGFGLGHALIASSLDSRIHNSYGIELSKERYNEFNRVKNKYNKELKNITISLGDFKTYKIPKTDIIYVSNLCFGQEIQNSLENKVFDEMQDDTLVFVSKEFKQNKLKQIGTITVPMSWNKSYTLYVYSKNKKNDNEDLNVLPEVTLKI